MENKVSIKQSQNVSVKDFSRILEINADLNYIQLRARFFGVPFRSWALHDRRLIFLLNMLHVSWQITGSNLKNTCSMLYSKSFPK